MWAERVSLNLPMRLALRVNCELPTLPDSTETVLSGVSLAREYQASGSGWSLSVTLPDLPE